MLHAAAMLTGLCAVWLIATQTWSSWQQIALAVASAAFCTLAAARLGGASPAFARAPAVMLLALSQIGAVVRGAASVVWAALSADVTLRPALVRIRSRSGRPAARAAFANMLSAAPGVAVVETDPDGFLAHVAYEDAVDPADLGRLEDGVRRATGDGAP
ncbi:MAG: Na+/H+ antiporter subunit E [Hyphomonadaceae bacterium]